MQTINIDLLFSAIHTSSPFCTEKNKLNKKKSVNCCAKKKTLTTRRVVERDYKEQKKIHRSLQSAIGKVHRCLIYKVDGYKTNVI